MKQKLLLFLGCMLMVMGMQAKEYSFTFEKKVFSKNETLTLNNVDWTLSGDGGGYWGYSSSTASKGQQFGSASYPYKSMTLSTSGITGKITSIKLNTSGASSIAGTVNVKVGNIQYGESSLTSTATDYEFSGNSSGDIVISFTQSSKKAIYIKSIVVLYTSDAGETPTEPTVPNTPTLTPSCSFIGTQEVTISCSTEGAAIYYTTDGTAPSSENGTLYDVTSFDVTETTTVKAIAVNENGASEVAEATYTKVEAMSIADAKAAYDESGDTELLVDLTGAVVTVNEGDYLFIQDETTGINIYKSGASYPVGTQFTQGILSGKSSAYNKMHQIVNAEFSDVETTTTTVTPIAVTVAQLNAGYATYEGRYVKLSDVTLAKTSITQGEDTYTAYDRFGLGFADDYSTATPCDIEGIVACYGTTLQIFPVVITVKEAVLPEVTPVGGESSENALTIEQGTIITIIPAKNNTVTYSINDAEGTTITETTVITADELGEMKLVVTSTFEGNTKTITYYYEVKKVTPKITATLTNAEIEAATNVESYSNQAFVDSKTGRWSGYMIVKTECLQINKNKEGYHIQSPAFPGKVVSVSVTFTSNTSTPRTFVVMPSDYTGATADESSYGCLGSATYDGTDGTVTATLSGDVNSFKIYSTNGAIYISAIKVVYEKPADHVLSIGSTGWATLYLGLDAIIPNDVKCYRVTKAENGVATLTEITSNLPAHTGVIVNAEESDYTFEYYDKYFFAQPTDNLLQGTLTDENIVAEENMAYYVLANPSDAGIGFYKASLNLLENTAFKNNANKAYLPLEATSDAALSNGYRFEIEGTTDVETSIAPQPSNVIYDITGRRVEKMEKGIYIVNGRKVVKN